MAPGYFAIGTLVLSSALAASSTVSTLQTQRPRPERIAGPAQLRAFGSRSPAQRRSGAGDKFDGALADLSRHAAQVRPDHALADLRALSLGARFQLSADGAAPLVLIDAVTRGDPGQLKAALEGLGLEHAAVYSNDVSGWLPVSQLEAAVARAEVHSIRAAMPHTRSGAVTSQGDFAQHSDVLRSSNGLTGAGVTVGLLSDSYDCYAVYGAPGSGVPASGAAGYASNGFTAAAATDVGSGDLPAGVRVLAEANCMNYLSPDSAGAPTGLPFGDEGRAMMQIVHDVAPGASLAFYTAENGEAGFAAGIGKLAAAGAKIIVDDVGYYDEPYYQDGLVAQAIDAAEAGGVAYFSAAGNDGTLAYENTAPHFGAAPIIMDNIAEYPLNFDPTGTTTTTALPVSIPALQPGEYVAVVVEWDQPYVTGAPASGGATSQVDVCITGVTGADYVIGYGGTVTTCTGANALGADPVQILLIGNPSNAAGNSAAVNINIKVALLDPTRAPGRIKVAVVDDGAGSTINGFPGSTPANTATATLQGHPGALGALAVGAAGFFYTPACGTTPASLERYSSAGGDPILFDSAGHRLAAPVTRNKPDVVGPDAANDTFLGFKLTASDFPGGKYPSSITQCQNEASYPNFLGTSAAAPHVASIAALMLQANPAVTPAQIYSALRASALPMGGGAGYNVDSGYGFAQADAALALIAPGAPTLSLAATSVLVGSSTTLTWSSINASGCTATGAWSGVLAANGTQTLTPAAAGTATYTLACTNTAGTSSATSVTLTATAAPPKSSGGGGGAIDVTALAGLAGLGLARLLRWRGGSQR